MSIRPVKSEDAPRIIEIYSPHILDGVASFENEVPSVAEIQQRIRDYTEKFPWLVYELEGTLAGYAYGSSHKSRCAYEWTAECSVYIDAKFQRQGIARELYTELFKLLKAQGVVNILAGITLPNTGSISLHESFGFKEAGTFKDVGFKQGQWWDVGWWQLQLQKPERPKPLGRPRP